MQGIEYIEEIFHFCFSAFARIEKQKSYVKQHKVLYSAVIECQKQYSDPESANVNWDLIKFFEDGRCAIHRLVENRCEHREEATEKAVINDNEHIKEVNCRGKQNKRKSGQDFFKRRGIICKKIIFKELQRVDQQNGERKGDKHTHIRIAVIQKINDLTYCGKNKYRKKISQFVFGISATFCDHKRKDRQGKSSEYAEYLRSGEENESDVVYKH